MNWWVGELKGHPKCHLIHEVFNPAADVMSAFKVRCTEKDIDFTRFTWDGPEKAPDFDPKDLETVVVLEVNLSDLQESFDFAWDWTKDGQSASKRWGGMISSPNNLRLLEGSEDFKPWTLRWRCVKLDTNVGKKPVEVRDPKTSPGLALMYVAAQHPQRMKATDHTKRFGWFIPGLECKTTRDKSWRSVPFIVLDSYTCVIFLEAYRYDKDDGSLAVPVFRE